jgi:hypothetical protein
MRRWKRDLVRGQNAKRATGEGSRRDRLLQHAMGRAKPAGLAAGINGG